MTGKVPGQTEAPGDAHLVCVQEQSMRGQGPCSNVAAAQFHHGFNTWAADPCA